MKTKDKEIIAGDFHLGNLIKQELKRQGRTASWLAAQVHCTPENIYKLCRQPWVSMPLMFLISLALGHDFFKDCSEHLQKKKRDEAIS